MFSILVATMSEYIIGVSGIQRYNKCYRITLLRGIPSNKLYVRLKEFTKFLKESTNHGVQIEYRVHQGVDYAELNVYSRALEKLEIVEKGLIRFRDVFTIDKCLRNTCMLYFDSIATLRKILDKHVKQYTALILDWKGFYSYHLAKLYNNYVDLSYTISIQKRLKTLIEYVRNTNSDIIVIIDAPELIEFLPQLEAIGKRIIILLSEKLDQYTLPSCNNEL